MSILMTAIVTKEMREDFVSKCRLGLQKYGGKVGKYVHINDAQIIGCCAVGGYLLSLSNLPKKHSNYLTSESIPKDYVNSGYVSGVIIGFDGGDKADCNTEDSYNGYLDGKALNKEFIK